MKITCPECRGWKENHQRTGLCEGCYKVFMATVWGTAPPSPLVVKRAAVAPPPPPPPKPAPPKPKPAPPPPPPVVAPLPVLPKRDGSTVCKPKPKPVEAAPAPVVPKPSKKKWGKKRSRAKVSEPLVTEPPAELRVGMSSAERKRIGHQRQIERMLDAGHIPIKGAVS